MLTPAQSTEQFLGAYVSKLKEVVPVNTGALRDSFKATLPQIDNDFTIQINALGYVGYVNNSTNFIDEADNVIDAYIFDYSESIVTEQLNNIIEKVNKL